ncbi:hypothetical protein HG530_007534 [Fusarium avenaceum]|nr:hypothetical protein HG530_007534 [Fusarium avenaceum]
MLSSSELTLTFSPYRLENSHDAIVAQALKDELHTIAALAHLVLGFGGGDALDAPLNTLRTPTADEAIFEPAILLSLPQLAPDLVSKS